MVNASGGVSMIFVLEFYSSPQDEAAQRLRTVIRDAPSAAQASRYARAMVKYTTIEDKILDHCLVKAQTGKVLEVVARN
jgi:hypothetical protein